MAEVKWKVSKDGKTVTVGGKTYSIAAFKSQFAGIEKNSGSGFRQISGPGMFEPGATGIAGTKIGAKPVKQVSAKTADEAKSRYEKKAAKKAASSLKDAKKPVKTAAAAKAREAAKKRATLTAPSKRSSGQKFTLRGGGAGGAFLENLK